jgi:hypothetical protein
VLTSWPNFAVKGDKEGGIWAIDRTSPMKFNSCGQSCSTDCSGGDLNIQTVRTGSFFHNNLAYWNKTLYISGTKNNGVTVPLTEYPIANLGQCPGGGNTGPICQAVAQGTCLSGTTCRSFGYGATPTVSSNGSDSSTAIVWAIEKTDLGNPYGGPPAILHAFRADNLNELYNSKTCPTRDKAGAASKFAVPTVANGLVFVPTQTELDIFGVFTGTPPTCN